MAERPSEHRTDEFADFGFERVPYGDKKAKVRGVFDSVASRYDLMNDAMSFGLHRLWKRFTVAKTGLKAGQAALDVAAGSADLSIPMARQVGPSGRVVVTDINREMLTVGRDRLLDAGIAGNATCLLADAESLPFADRSFHCVTIGFGLRNVTDKDAALRSMFRILKPGGRLLVLEPRRARRDDDSPRGPSTGQPGSTHPSPPPTDIRFALRRPP